MSRATANGEECLKGYFSAENRAFYGVSLLIKKSCSFILNRPLWQVPFYFLRIGGLGLLEPCAVRQSAELSDVMVS